MFHGVYLDFETRSRCDINRGTDLYASDPSTDILMMAYTRFPRHLSDPNVAETPVTIWKPGDPIPNFLRVMASDPDAFFFAHYARFDQAIWEFIAVERYGFPLVAPEKWYCSSAQARVNALPASLDGAARALDLAYKKDTKGQALIRKLCIPDKDGNFNTGTASDWRDFEDYCKADVATGCEILHNCRIMNQREYDDYQLNERINDRGIRVDADFAIYAQQYAEAEMADINKEITTLSGGAITKATQRKRIADAVEQLIPVDILKLLTVYKNGERKISLAKENRENVFARVEDQSRHYVTSEWYRLLQLYDGANNTSVAKYRKMLDLSDDECKVRGAFKYAGAATLRYTSSGLQLHNFTRSCLTTKAYKGLKRRMLHGRPVPGILKLLRKALRPTLIPDPGHVFIVSDWSSIENRKLPWLACDVDRINVFRRIDADPSLPDTYTLTAQQLRLPNRQAGKVVELAMGYGGGVGALTSMANMYGMSLESLGQSPEAIVNAWRANNRWASEFWTGLYKCASLAVKSRYTSHWEMVPFTDVGFMYTDKLVKGGALLCRLPSGTIITYAHPEYDRKAGLSALKPNWSPAAGDTVWPSNGLWHGLLAENVTQAECSALLRHALRLCADDGLDIVLHCHDEIVIQAPIDEADFHRDQLHSIMTDPGRYWPSMHSFPLNAETKIVERYGK